MELIECGIPPGLAHTIIKILQEVKILSKSGKFVSSNSYFLTVLSSLKLLRVAKGSMVIVIVRLIHSSLIV